MKGLRQAWVFGSAFFLFAQFVHAETTPERKPEEYWNETPVTFELLKTFLNQENCDSSQAKFIGCIEAMNVLAGQLTPPRELATAVIKSATPSTYGPSEHSFGAISVYQLVQQEPKTSDTPLKLWKKQKSKQETRNDSLSKIFTQGKARSVDFSSIIDYFAPAIPNERQALTAATAINVYYSSAVDPHTHIDAWNQVAAEMESNGSNFIGIGVILNPFGGKIVVKSPLRGSPAFAAGLKANDIILAIDGKKVDGMEFNKVVSLIRGPEGTPVVLTVSRKGKTLKLPITRGQIQVANVSSRILDDRGVKYGYIKLESFMEKSSCDEVLESIVNLIVQDAQALILDLRGNTGGRVDQAQCIGGLFLGPNQVVAQVKDLDSDQMTPKLSPEGIVGIRQLPMLTLIDSDSASASEILAGALQDDQRSWIAGARSFGKATVQDQADWVVAGKKINGVVLYHTTKRFYQPSGRTNQVVGIEPDFELDPKPKATDDDRFALRESELHSNYLPPLGKKWVQPRPLEVTRIKGCVAASGIAEQLYAQHIDDAVAPDYQIFEAEDYLACAFGPATEPSR